jgi:LmbE family N-acetylglucosaminyl deacetylase
MPHDDVTTIAARGAAVVVAAHLDDAALSLGGTIAQLADSSAVPPTIVTVFAGSPPTLSPFARAYHSANGLSGDVIERRRKEEHASAAVLGAHVELLSYPEILYRGARSLADAFGALTLADRKLVAAIARDLADREPLRAAQTLAIPLSVGDHRDHVLTRCAAEIAAARIHPAPDIVHYEDMPYVARRPPSEWASLVPVRAAPQLVPMDDATWRRKCRSVECHESQLPILWPNEKTFRAEIAAYMQDQLRVSKAERIWSYPARGQATGATGLEPATPGFGDRCSAS